MVEKVTLLCLMVGGRWGGGQIAFFEIFHPQKHFIMNNPNEGIFEKVLTPLLNTTPHFMFCSSFRLLDAAFYATSFLKARENFFLSFLHSI